MLRFAELLTPDGLQYVEENLLTDEDLAINGLKDTANFIKSGTIIISLLNEVRRGNCRGKQVRKDL